MRAIGFVVLILAALSLTQTPASAISRGFGFSSGENVGASVSSTEDTDAPKHSTKSSLKCTTAKVEGDVAIDPNAFLNGANALLDTSSSGAWYETVCTDTAGVMVSDRQYWLTDQVAPKALAQEAFNETELPKPGIDLSPSNDTAQIVGVPVWLSVQSAQWAPVSATANVGTESVTTTASPTSVVWSFGDGSNLTCSGPGITYDKSKSSRDQSSDCTHTYTQSSRNATDGKFTITATVHWKVGWVATGVTAGAPGAGDLGDVTSTSSVLVTVSEVEALGILSGK